MYIVLVSAEPNDTFGVFPSAIMKRSGWRRAVRTNAQSSVFMRRLRRWNASACSSCTALRTWMAVDVGGIGVPKLTVTGYGMRRGTFHRNRPRSKLKMLPHTPSRFTGMMGTSTPFMMRSRPRRKGNNWPVRVICPSAKMQTISSLCRASVAVCSERIISRGRCSLEMGMAFIILANGLMILCS